MISCRYSPDGEPTGKFVVYLVATLLPDWAPPAPASRRALVGEKAEAVLAGAATGKSLRELAREVEVSHGTIRTTIQAVEWGEPMADKEKRWNPLVEDSTRINPAPGGGAESRQVSPRTCLAQPEPGLHYQAFPFRFALAPPPKEGDLGWADLTLTQYLLARLCYYS